MLRAGNFDSRNIPKWVTHYHRSVVLVGIVVITHRFYGEPHVVMALDFFPYDGIVVAATIAKQLELLQLLATHEANRSGRCLVGVKFDLDE